MPTPCRSVSFGIGEMRCYVDRKVELKMGEDLLEGRRALPMAKRGGSKVCVRGHWRLAEDARLRELVTRFGPQNWNLVAEHLQGRSGKSCRLRWFNQLDPRIDKRAFSEEEEERLLAAHRAYGNKWAVIARLFPGRTDNAVKNHWHVTMSRKHREQSFVYRRRRSAPSNIIIRCNDNARQVHMKSESMSSMSNEGDVSASTCTGLSLTPSSAIPSPALFFGSARDWLTKEAADADENPVPHLDGGSSECLVRPSFIDFLGIGVACQPFSGQFSILP